MNLLLQLNGDLPERFKGHERRLYIYSCKRKACRRKSGSIRAIRGARIASGVSKDDGKESQNKSSQLQSSTSRPPDLGSSIFNSRFTPPSSAGQNPFAPQNTHDGSKEIANPFESTSGASNAPQDKQPDAASDQQYSKLPTLFAEKARINASDPPKVAPVTTKPKPWPKQSNLPVPYPSYYLDADYETLEASPQPSTQSINGMSMDTSEPSDPGTEKDAFESTIDKTFQRFADRLAQNPEQILRYEFDGTPLLYSTSDTVGLLLAPRTASSSSAEGEVSIAPSANSTAASASGFKGVPHCPSCGARRVFELQLVPHAITELEAEEEGLEGMDWGTVILCVCSRDCSDNESANWAWKEEWIGVQWEELDPKSKGKGKG